MSYRIEYSPDAIEHLRGLTVRDRRTAMNRLERLLSHEPTIETRNRKPMRPNPVAPWELRVGSIRVYYDVEDDPEPVVVVLAVGIKEHNRVRIGKEVLEI